MMLTSYENINQENIFFNEAKEYKVKDSKIKYKPIPIEVKYPNGKKGALVLESPVLFSFGVNEKKNQETNKLVGYSMPVCLWARDSEPNNKEKAFFDVINNVTTFSQQHLENEYGADLASSLSSPFYYKQIEYTDKKGKKRTKVDESSAPVLYAKLIYSEKSRKILSLFKGKGGRDLNPFKGRLEKPETGIRNRNGNGNRNRNRNRNRKQQRNRNSNVKGNRYKNRDIIYFKLF